MTSKLQATQNRQKQLSALLLSALLVCAGISYHIAAELPVQYMLHMGLMLAAWGVIFPVGALLARFFKVTREQDFPRETDNQFWWTWHQSLQYLGTILASIATFLIWQKTGWGSSTHAQLGSILLSLAWLQLISGWLRGSKGGPTDKVMAGDHFDMTPRRKAFEHWHKTAGWTALLLALFAIGTGLQLIGQPAFVYVGLPIVIGTIHTILFARFSKQGRRIDTYVAIWGQPAPNKERLHNDRLSNP